MFAMNEDEYQRGAMDAEADVACGKVRLFWQTRGKWGELFTKLMLERFDVKVVHVGDIKTYAQVSYERGYNDLIEANIDRVFGTGSFDAAWNEIQDYRSRK